MSILEQLQVLADLTHIDVSLAELQEELGDLPIEVKHLEKEARAKQQALDATHKQKDDAIHIRASAKVYIQELHDKEKKLADQQFQVRNNREFDAISKEIETIKSDLRNAERDIGAANVTEENLEKLIAAQQEELDDAASKLSAKEQELLQLSGDHNEELTQLLGKRGELTTQLPAPLLVQYERIKEYHTNVAVEVRRNSCSGCFNAVPPQKLVEMRAYKQIYTCENCGRILYPEKEKDKKA